MDKKIVYETDRDGFLLYSLEVQEQFLDPGKFHIPHTARELEPPAVPAGMVARWVDDGWEVVEDHRRDVLYIAATGATYAIGSDVDIDGTTMRYDGGGPIAAWLTDTAPSVADQVES